MLSCKSWNAILSSSSTSLPRRRDMSRFLSCSSSCPCLPFVIPFVTDFLECFLPLLPMPVVRNGWEKHLLSKCTFFSSIVLLSPVAGSLSLSLSLNGDEVLEDLLLVCTTHLQSLTQQLSCETSFSVYIVITHVIRSTFTSITTFARLSLPLFSCVDLMLSSCSHFVHVNSSSDDRASLDSRVDTTVSLQLFCRTIPDYMWCTDDHPTTLSVNISTVSCLLFSCSKALIITVSFRDMSPCSSTTHSLVLTA